MKRIFFVKLCTVFLVAFYGLAFAVPASAPPPALTAASVVRAFAGGTCSGFLYSTGTCMEAVTAESDPLALKTAGTDNVKDTHIDWGAGAGQVNLDDVPDSASYHKLTAAKDSYLTTAMVEENIIDDYGAVGDAWTELDGVAVASDNTFTSADSAFDSDDVGKTIILHGVGANALNLQTTIASINSPTSVELADAPTLSATGVEFVYGTNDTASFQAFGDSLTRNDFTSLVFKAHSDRKLVVPVGKRFLLATGVSITQKDDFILTGGGEIIFNDIRAFTLTSCRNFTFDNLQWEGMTYNSPNTAPTYSTAIYLTNTDTTFDKRSRAAHITNNRFRRMKHFVTGDTTWNGVEEILWKNNGVGYDVKDSIAFDITNFSDNELTGNAVSGFQTPFRLSANAVATTLSGNHPYSDYGIVDAPFTGNTTSGSNTISAIADTSNVQVGRKYKVSAGYADANYYYTVSSKTASTVVLVDDSGAAVNATSSETGVTLQNHTSDYALDISAQQVTAVNNEFDHAKIAIIHITDPTNISITNNTLFRAQWSGSYMVSFDPPGADTLSGVVVKNNNFLASTGYSTAPFYYNGNVTLATSTDTELGPNNYGLVTTKDNRWYVDTDQVISDGTTSTTWGGILGAGAGSWVNGTGGIYYNGGKVAIGSEVGTGALTIDSTKADASDAAVHISGNVNKEKVLVDSYGGSPNAPSFVGRTSHGAKGSESYPTSTDTFFQLTGQGWHTDGTPGFSAQAKIAMIPPDGVGWGDGSRPTIIRFYNTPTSSTTMDTAMTIGQDKSLTVVGGGSFGSDLSVTGAITATGRLQPTINSPTAVKFTKAQLSNGTIIDNYGQSGAVTSCLPDISTAGGDIGYINFILVVGDTDGWTLSTANSGLCAASGYGGASNIYLNGASTGTDLVSSGTVFDQVHCRAVRDGSGLATYSCFKEVGTGWN